MHLRPRLITFALMQDIVVIGAGNLGLSIATGILHSGGATTMYLTRRNLDDPAAQR